VNAWEHNVWKSWYEYLVCVHKGSSWCFDDAKGLHVSQSFIQDQEIKDIQDG